MACWTVSELMYLTHDELCDLSRRTELGLAEFAAGTVERIDALTTLSNIRRVTVLRGLYL
jgi:hypothetical protein